MAVELLSFPVLYFSGELLPGYLYLVRWCLFISVADKSAFTDSLKRTKGLVRYNRILESSNCRKLLFHERHPPKSYKKIELSGSALPFLYYCPASRVNGL
jgi:hypothetical protein